MKNTVIRILKQPIVYIMLICIFFQINIYKTAPEYTMTPDSYSYAEGYTQNIFKAEVNSSRTPVYPYFIKIIKKIAGVDNYLRNVVIAQKILFLFTILLFYFSIKKIIHNKIIISILTIILGICPFTVIWNILILTEAISLFEMALLCYLTISYIKKPGKVFAILVNAQVLIMILTRPAFIYLIPIYVLFWIMKFILDKREKENILSAFISMLCCILLILGYCGLMKKQHDTFSITSVSYINNVISVIYSDSYIYSDNKEIIELIDNMKQVDTSENTCWDILEELEEKYSKEELKQFTKTAIKNSPNYISYVLRKTINLGNNSIGIANYVLPKEEYSNINYDNIGNIILPINFALVYLMVLILAVFLLYDLIKNIHIDWIIAIYTCIIVANIFTLIVGAPFEEQRLFLPSIMCLLLLIGYVFEFRGNNMQKNDTKNRKKMENRLMYRLFIEKTDNSKIQFFRYIFVGGFAAVVNIGSLYIFKEALHMHYLIANILGFVLGLITNYLLSKYFVFAKEKSINKILEFIIYAIIGVVGLGFDTMFMWIFTDKVGMYFMISKLLSTGIVFIWNFGGKKLLYMLIDKKIGGK